MYPFLVITQRSPTREISILQRKLNRHNLWPLGSTNLVSSILPSSTWNVLLRVSALTVLPLDWKNVLPVHPTKRCKSDGWCFLGQLVLVHFFPLIMYHAILVHFSKFLVIPYPSRQWRNKIGEMWLTNIWSFPCITTVQESREATCRLQHEIRSRRASYKIYKIYEQSWEWDATKCTLRKKDRRSHVRFV